MLKPFLLTAAAVLAACQPGSETAASARTEAAAPSSSVATPATTTPASVATASPQEGRDPFVVVRNTRRGGSGEGVAWWLRDMDVDPDGGAVSGVSIAALNAHRGAGKTPWCAANAMSRSSFTSESSAVRAEIDQSMADTAAANFAIHGVNITGSGPQDGVVGAFETCDGQVGSFLLITDRETRPNIVRLEEWSDWKGLIRLQERDDGLFVSSCFECDAELRIDLPEGAFPDRRRLDR